MCQFFIKTHTLIATRQLDLALIPYNHVYGYYQSKLSDVVVHIHLRRNFFFFCRQTQIIITDNHKKDEEK